MSNSQVPDVSADKPTYQEALKKAKTLSGFASLASKSPDDYLEHLKEYVLSQKEKETFSPVDAGAALLKSASSLSSQVADVLIKAGALTDIVDPKTECDFLQKALLSKNHELVLYCINEGGFSADHKESDGTTLLMTALTSRQFDFAEKLIESGANVNARLTLPGNSDTALHMAAAKGDFQGVIWLMENNADPTIENKGSLLACELVPKMVGNAADDTEWDMDVMFQTLESYRTNYTSGDDFKIPSDMIKMAYLEHTPISAMEDNRNKMILKAKYAPPESIIPKQVKKLGGF